MSKLKLDVKNYEGLTQGWLLVVESVDLILLLLLQLVMLVVFNKEM